MRLINVLLCINSLTVNSQYSIFNLLHNALSHHGDVGALYIVDISVGLATILDALLVDI